MLERLLQARIFEDSDFIESLFEIQVDFAIESSCIQGIKKFTRKSYRCFR